MLALTLPLATLLATPTPLPDDARFAEPVLLTEDVLLASFDIEQEVNDFLVLKAGARFRSAKRDNKTTELFIGAAEGNNRVYPVGQFADPADGNFTLWDGIYSDIAGPFVRADPAYDFFFNDYQSSPDNWAWNRSDL